MSGSRIRAAKWDMSGSRAQVHCGTRRGPGRRWVGPLGLAIVLGGFCLAGADDAGLKAYHRARLEEIRADIANSGFHWTADLTTLTVYSPDELQAMLGERMPAEYGRRLGQVPALAFPLRRDLPSSFDWRAASGVTPVKNQGACGSCWDFAGVAALESAILIHGGVEWDLSEQQILSCATPGTGCSGGWSDMVFRYIREHGAVTEECMPYEADDQIPCTDEECDKVAAVRNWIDIPNGIDEIKTALYEYGPLKTSLYVYDDFFYYTEGCYEHEDQVTWTNHAVVIVGWDDEACDGNGAWLIKNSWSTGWGEEGFGWIKYGNCNIGTATILVYYYPAIDLERQAADVLDGRRGDGDGWFDPGEMAELQVEIRNALLAETRTGIQAELLSATPGVTVVTALAGCSDLEAGETGVLDPPFVVAISPLLPIGSELSFQLLLTADGGYAVADTFALVLGDVPILLVDDDNSTVADPYLRASLAEGGYLYRHWDTMLSGPPAAEVLSRYAAVVWITGISGRFDQDDQVAVETFVGGGGALLATGQDIGWYLHEWSGATQADQEFYENTFHATYVADGSGYMALDGVAGDPIGDGLSFGIGGGDGSRSQAWPSQIAERAGSVAIFNYAPDCLGAVRWEGSYRVVYFAFGIEAIDTAPDRATVVARSLEWLVPQWPDIEQPQVVLTSPNGGEIWWPGTTATIAWDASDNVGVIGIDLELSRDGGVAWTEMLASGIANTGVFEWIVSGDGSAACLIRATAHDAVGLLNQDASDSLFTILPMTADLAEAQPACFAFLRAAPNPFVHTTELSLALPAPERIEIGIHDPAGRCVRTLCARQLPAGIYHFTWRGVGDDGWRLPGGIYLARVTREQESSSQRLLLIR